MTDTPSSFDPKEHRVAALRGFSQLRIGEVFNAPSRTIDAANFAAFQAVSRQSPDPLRHRILCAAGPSSPLAHGLQVLSFTAAGAGLFPHVIGESLIGFIEVNAKFLKAVYPGDTLYPALEITELTPQRTTGIVAMRASVHNQKRELVLDGTHRYLLKLDKA